MPTAKPSAYLCTCPLGTCPGRNCAYDQAVGLAYAYGRFVGVPQHVSTRESGHRKSYAYGQIVGVARCSPVRTPWVERPRKRYAYGSAVGIAYAYSLAVGIYTCLGLFYFYFCFYPASAKQQIIHIFPRI
jgi:hypothetical protein